MSEIQSIEQRKGYWRTVGKRALQSAWKDAGMKSRTITALVLIILAALAGISARLGIIPFPFASSQASSAIAGTTTFFISLIVLAVLFFVALIRIPPIIDQEKQEEIDRQKGAISQLQEKATPKLEICYDGSDRNSYQVWGTTSVYRIKVKNVGGEQIRDIVTEIREICPVSYDNLPVELHFTNDAPNLLNPTQTVFVDVIQVHLVEVGDVFFYTKKTDWRYKFLLQDYEILISVSGHNSPAIEKWFRFSVSTSNKEYNLTFKEESK